MSSRVSAVCGGCLAVGFIQHNVERLGDVEDAFKVEAGGDFDAACHQRRQLKSFKRQARKLRPPLTAGRGAYPLKEGLLLRMVQPNGLTRFTLVCHIKPMERQGERLGVAAHGLFKKLGRERKDGGS